jgi:hypothetical protein
MEIWNPGNFVASGFLDGILTAGETEYVTLNWIQGDSLWSGYTSIRRKIRKPGLSHLLKKPRIPSYGTRKGMCP